MNKHTPGPWVYNKDRSEIVSTSHWLIEPTEEEPGIPTSIVSVVGAMGGDDTEADAKLIAAAPELLEALELILDTDRELWDFYMWQKVGAAIAKAKGE